MNSEELKIIGAERKKILNDILEELQTKSLKELFLETSDKEKRIEEVKDILEHEYKLLDDNEFFAKYYKEKENEVLWITYIIETQERIHEIENDYSNYIQGGEGYISGYLSAINE